MCRPCQKNKKAMKSFDFTAFSGAMEGTRTPGLLIRSDELPVLSRCKLCSFIQNHRYFRFELFLFIFARYGSIARK